MKSINELIGTTYSNEEDLEMVLHSEGYDLLNVAHGIIEIMDGHSDDGTVHQLQIKRSFHSITIK